MERQLLSWKERLEVIQRLVENASAGTRDKLANELAELRMLESQGRIHIRRVEAVAAAAWEFARSDIMSGWRKLAHAFDAGWIRIRILTR